MRLRIVELPSDSVLRPLRYVVDDTDTLITNTMLSGVSHVLGAFYLREDAKKFMYAKLYESRTLLESASRSPINDGEENTYPTYTVSTTDVN